MFRWNVLLPFSEFNSKLSNKLGQGGAGSEIFNPEIAKCFKIGLFPEIVDQWMDDVV
jgi:hypothetical protein